jgi:hypothetical protein
LATLSIGSSAVAKQLSSAFAGNPAVIVINTLTFAADGTARFDLTNNELFTQSAVPPIRMKITLGQLFTSSAGGVLGYVDAGAGTTEVRFTLPGDLNLDGTVDIADLGALSTNYGLTSGATWAQGDVDNSGTVDIADLGYLATYFGSSLATGPSSVLAMSLARRAR